MVDRILSHWEHGFSQDFEEVTAHGFFMAHCIDSKGNLINVSEAWAFRLGYSIAEMLGKPSTDFLLPSSRKKAIEYYLPKFFEEGGLKNVRYVFQAKDGSEVPVIMTARAKFVQGQFDRSIAIFLDNGIAEAVEDIQTALLDTVTDLEGLRTKLDNDGQTHLNNALANLSRALDSRKI